MKKGIHPEEYRTVVFKDMASETGIIIIYVSADVLVEIVGFWIFMTGNTGKLRIVAVVRMTFNTVIPNPLVFTTVDGKVLNIM